MIPERFVIDCLPLLTFLPVSQVLGVEHSDVLDEIEQLRGRLRGMETAVVSGQQSPSAVKVCVRYGRHISGPCTPVYLGSLHTPVFRV